MRKQKYIDMAYTNPKGKEWLRVLHRPEFWREWCSIVRSISKESWIPDKKRPDKIVITAIYHFGYANNSPSSKELRRAAQRLRIGPPEPPDSGEGRQKRSLYVNGNDMSTFGMPREFWYLEQFLEYKIRPHLDSVDKISPEGIF